MINKNQTTHLRREVLVNIIQSFFSDKFTENINKIPFTMRPKNSEVPYRCCIHKERAVLRARTIAGLGGSLSADDEMRPLAEYGQDALKRDVLDEKAITIVSTACHGCVPSRVYITDLCQGCVARPCESSCKFGAISIINGRSVIDESKCKNCTICIKACPYNAIVKRVVPCEDACPVDAIAKNDLGVAEVDFDKCISCGACIFACPFGAVSEKSQLIDVLKAIKAGKNVVAMLAPAIVGQLPNSINQIATGLVKAGFSKVYEVAQGADLTTKHEAHDFKERMEKGDSFMTTSCCAAYNELIAKHIPQMKPFASETPTPMFYTAEIAKKEDPECVSVFIGPCVAKRKEGMQDKNVDYVMSFDEIGALFVALHIQLAKCEDYVFETPSSTQGRNFAVTGGVAKAVSDVCDKNIEIKPVHIEYFDRKNINKLKLFANKGECAEGNLIEVMACYGGCVGGAMTINDKRIAAKEIKKYSEEGESLEMES